MAILSRQISMINILSRIIDIEQKSNMIPLSLNQVYNQTEQICMYYISKDWSELRYAINQTEAMCLCAVKGDSQALKFVNHQTEAICLEAVGKFGDALQYVHNQTEAICLCAVKQYPYALRFVKNQTEKICIEAVQKNGHTIEYVHNQTEAICITAITHCDFALQYIEYPSLFSINKALAIDAKNMNCLNRAYVAYLLDTYTKYGICMNDISAYVDEILYRPNNVNGLLTHSRNIALCPKLLFLL
jgi:hypothetical protein